MKAVFALLVLALVGCSATAASASTQRTDAIINCGTVVGAKWVFPGTGGKISGTKYGVTAVGVSCDLAKKYAVKLSSAKLAGKTTGKSYPLAGGPPGFTCSANPDANGKVIAASCQVGPKNKPSKKAFSFGGRPG